MKKIFYYIFFLLFTLNAYAQDEQAKYEKANQLYYKAIEALNNKEYEKTITYCDEVIEIGGDYRGGAYNFRGLAKHHLQQYETAIADYDLAIKHSPKQAAIYDNRANAKYELKDYEGALKDYSMAVQFNKKFTQAYIHRALTYQQLEEYQRAIRDLDKALEFEPLNETAVEHRVVVAKILREKGEEVTSYVPVAAVAPPKEKTISQSPKTSKRPKVVVNRDVSKERENKDISKREIKTNKKEGKGEIATKDSVIMTSYIVNRTDTTKKTAPKEASTIEEQPIAFNAVKEQQKEVEKQGLVEDVQQLIKQQQLTEQRRLDSLSQLKAAEELARLQEKMKQERLDIFWLSPNIDELNGELLSENGEVTLKLKAFSYDPLTEKNFLVYVNDKLYAPKFGEVSLKNRQNTYTYSSVIQLQENADHLHTIQVKVSNKMGSKNSESLRVLFNPKKPNLHILAIGTNPINLEFTQQDAKDFAQLFAQQGSEQSDDRLFDKVYIKMLLGDKATSQEIKGIMEEYRYTQNIHPKDLFIIFLSSHGFSEGSDFWLQGSEYNPLRKFTTSVSYRNGIINKLDKINCKKIIFIDACQSGGAKAAPSNLNKAIQKISQRKNGTTTITSSSEEQLSYEDKKWKNGAFTEGIVLGLAKGEADGNADKLVTINELYQYLRTVVPEMVLTTKNERQIPFMTKNDLGDLPIYVIE